MGAVADDPALSACPEREACLSLLGAPIGMYHCGHCGDMVLAGMDPTPYCGLNGNRDRMLEEA